jgi:peroxiredoxin Q/BCP
MHPLEQKKAPAFTLEDQNGEKHSLADFKGKWIVLYFYPKDMTPGCTVEACSFRDSEARLTAKGVQVLGVSADSVKSHGRFAKTFSLPFPLLSDPENIVSRAYESFGKKKFMGREYEGILRNTYLINPVGEIAKVYEGVKVKVHVDEVLKDLESFQQK